MLTLAQARTSVTCLIDEIHTRFGEASASESPSLDAWAQSHFDGSAPPGAQAVSWGGTVTGTTTPYGMVAALMRSGESCIGVLDGQTEVGVGFVNHALLGPVPKRSMFVTYALSPTWDLVLDATEPPLPESVLEGCPYTLALDVAGQGAPVAEPGLALFYAHVTGRRLLTTWVCVSPSGDCRATVHADLPGAGAHASLPVIHLKLHAHNQLVHLRFNLNAGALVRERRRAAPALDATFEQQAPVALSYEDGIRLAGR